MPSATCTTPLRFALCLTLLALTACSSSEPPASSEAAAASPEATTTNEPAAPPAAAGTQAVADGASAVEEMSKATEHALKAAEAATNAAVEAGNQAVEASGDAAVEAAVGAAAAAEAALKQAAEAARAATEEAVEAAKKATDEAVEQMREALPAPEAAPPPEAPQDMPEVHSAEAAAGGTTHTVTANVTNFDPMVTFIDPGDQVSFVNMNGHNTTSIAGLIPEGATPWESALGEAHTQRFEVPGAYVYKCTPHASAGMIAAVVVGPNPPANLAVIEASPENRGMVGRTIRKLKQAIEAH